ncbi:MAG: glutamine-synthetase adenylyltransferase, partial [Bryobacteraceae bacterium]
MPPSLDAHLGARSSKPLAFLSEFPQGSAERIKALLAASADRDGAEYYLAEFHARHPSLLTQIAATRPRLQWLITIFGFSRFLSEELLQHPDRLNDVPDVYRVLTVSDYTERLSWFLAERNAGSVGALDLALFRRREIFRIAVRDALNFGTLSEITEELSSLADAILQRALNAVFDDLASRYGRPALDPESEAGSQGFCVLALGKLGGRELNYSSDIDLLFLYSVNGETSRPEAITNREFYKKLGNRLTEILSTYTAEGLCYRVDLRLRPEGSLGEICISIEGAKEY